MCNYLEIVNYILIECGLLVVKYSAKLWMLINNEL